MAGAGEGDAEGSSTGLARALVAFETEIERDPPAVVILADDSDASLAAALVALKRLIAVEADEAATATRTVNARLIAQLTETYTSPR